MASDAGATFSGATPGASPMPDAMRSDSVWSTEAKYATIRGRSVTLHDMIHNYDVRVRFLTSLLFAFLR